MPKRGEKATHRVRYTYGSGHTGTITAWSHSDALYRARNELAWGTERADGLTATIELITGPRTSEPLATYTNLDDLQAAIDDDFDNDRAKAAALGDLVPQLAPPVDTEPARRGPGRPPKGTDDAPAKRIHVNLDGDRLAAVDQEWQAARAANPKATRTSVIEALIDEAIAARRR